MKAQAASLPFTPVFNTKLPQVGELVSTRVISQFRKSFMWNQGWCLFFVIDLFFKTTTYLLLDCLSFHDYFPRPSRRPISLSRA